ncbi:unnamed protein product [Adineta steineri]|uniref:Uncharacterized protein n=1 Tax=Adineta steineri TaxID=433720 RepID=A0A819FSZ0_9BILA|nr:unnamed protein product [Adineta steineri]
MVTSRNIKLFISTSASDSSVHHVIDVNLKMKWLISTSKRNDQCQHLNEMVIIVDNQSVSIVQNIWNVKRGRKFQLLSSQRVTFL